MIELNDLQSIVKFKEGLVSQIPYAPSDGESKRYLIGMDIGEVIHIYDFWRQRFIFAAPREVRVSSKIRNSHIYLKHRDKINEVLTSVRLGHDLSGYLSSKASKSTFDVQAFKGSKSFNSFRDTILICEGFYHLHLEKFPGRTDHVLLAEVTGGTFEVVCIATHALFENNSAAKLEYQRHIDEFLRLKLPEGGILLGGAAGGMQNLAGSSIQSTLSQIRARRCLQNVEIYNGGLLPYTRKLYKHLHGRDVSYAKPEWRMQERALVIFDRKNKETFAGEHLMYRFE